VTCSTGPASTGVEITVSPMTNANLLGQLTQAVLHV
jgi:hypothetical protein